MPLEALNPLDGRYLKHTAELRKFFSEHGLIKYRIVMEGEYLIALRNLPPKEQKAIRALYNITPAEAQKVKDYEAVTNHDVKAVEYYIKEKLKKNVEWVHFALTSEDTNNISYGLMLSESLRDVIIPTLDVLVEKIRSFAKEYAKLPMLARTHGQSASPTTLGKEFKVFQVRLEKQMKQLKNYRVSVKLNGATGNYNAHLAAFPKKDWPKFTKDFIASLSKIRNVKLEANLVTTQIEPHDTYTELFDLVRRINTILIGFNQDMWRYISDGWIIQKPKEGEVGSSTMPHKVNPIDFENSEGNLGMANALLSHFSAKLPISRLQRDLTDSTVERNFGVAFGYSLVAYKSTMKGLGKISAHKEKILEELEKHQEVVAEAIQTVLRREGAAMPYEALKKLTRGKTVTRADFEAFIADLPVPAKVKKELLSFTPQKYTGLASKL